MLRAEATADGVAAIGRLRPSVTVRATDWRAGEGSTPGDAPPPIRESVADSAVGRATGLELPLGRVTVTHQDTGRTWELTGEETLTAGTYALRVDSVVEAQVAFTAAARVSKTQERASLTFPAPTSVRVGFAERDDRPPGTLTAARTPESVATVVSTLSTSTLTTTAARSHSRMRRHPPLIEFGEATEIPPAFADRRTQSDVTITVPPTLQYVFATSSLAHYLGATLEVAEGATPTLRAPDVEHRLDEMPGYQYETAELLRRVFLLDCLVREAVPGNDRLAEHHLLDRLPLDSDAVATASIGERVETYLDVPFDLISPDLPEWHLSMYVEPTYDHVRTLPHVISNLPNIFAPKSQPLEGNERLRRSLDDFYRAPADDSARIEPVKPILGPGRAHGWLADGIPIDVFKTLSEAYEHRSGGDHDTQSTSVVAVLNDAEMSSEHDDAADIYRRGTADLDIDVSVREQLSRAELAAVFEADHDFVHYIGHCEEDGLQCRDGALSTSTLDHSAAETFFLNACGSYYEGIDLVRKGSVAGAVTFEKVLDGHAARVGTMFVRLLVNGFSIERALDLARRRIIMGNDYTVVGDGTHKLSGAPETVPLAATIVPRDDDETYRVTFDASSPRVTGDVFRLPEPLDGQPRLFGAESEMTLSATETERFVRSVDIPVIFDGDIQWSTDLVGQIPR
ncbi:hypothetical protein [Salinigranum halophilum]|uniref:hypothetical protein n=1 Tax=Salinigranum halophilum TaxID=2565931 RepID=UPI0010A78799|nr:hypothetical protein [Salinigranum halophilum]